MIPEVPQSPTDGHHTGPDRRWDELTAIRVGIVPPDRTFAAARRLVGASQVDPDAAAARLIENGRAGRIDLSLMFAAEKDAEVRQVCLLAPSSGRTGAVFLSEPLRTGDPGGEAAAEAERAACVVAAEAHVRAHLADRIAVLQALPEPEEAWNIRALTRAGFAVVGELTYLRRPIGKTSGVLGRAPAMPAWPVGIKVTLLSELSGGYPRQRELLCQLLESTYVGTLDCPALCGIRATTDVLESHHAVGQFDPSLWVIVFDGETPAGCMLLSKSQELRSVELVYLGLAPSVRGRGLGTKLLDYALRLMPRSGYDMLTCAVDRKNAPAVKLYQNAGFRPFGERVALVKQVGSAG